MITVGILFRDRHWILQFFLDSLKQALYYQYLRLEFPIHLIFLVDEDGDNSVSDIVNGTVDFDCSWIKVTVIGNKCDYPKDSRDGMVRDKYIYSHLANLRNQVINLFLKSKDEYLYFVDSDILLEKEFFVETLKELQKDQVGVCSTFIANDFGKGVIGNIMEDKNGLVHIRNYDGELKEVDLTGACFGIKREVLLDPRSKYGYTGYGEDGYFCREIKKLGWKLFCIGKYAKHFMSKEQLEEYINGIS